MNIKNKINLLFALGLILMLSGCGVTSPLVSQALDKQAKQFKPSSTKANIYIYRNEYLGGALSKNIHVNNKLIGTTGAMNYFLLEVKPGKYTIHSDDDPSDKIVIDARARRNYFVWQEMKMGFFVGGTELSKVDSKTGREAVMECVRVKANF